jgi:uncharacterized protein (TIGR03437 family)
MLIAAVNTVATNMPVGTYNGAVVLTSGNVSQMVPAALNATAASSTVTLSASPSSMTFNYTQGGSTPPSEQVRVTALNGASVPITAIASSTGNWLSVTPSGTTPAALTVSTSPAGIAPGSYTGAITINGGGAAQGQSTTVTAYLNVVAAQATVIVSTSAMSFTAQAGAGATAAQTFTVTSASPTAFQITGYPTWLSVSPSGSLTTNQTITVAANPAGLSPGAYSGTIGLSWGMDTSGVQVAFTVTAGAPPSPAVTVSPSSLAFWYEMGGTNPGLQQLAVAGPNGAQQAFTVSATSAGNWLTVVWWPGITPATLMVSVVPASLAAGTYNGSISVTPAGGTAVTVPVSLVVARTAAVAANPSSLSFAYAVGGSVPGGQSVQVSSVAGASVAFAAASSAGWFSVSPASGTAPAMLTVSIVPSGLAAGTYSGNVTVTPAGGSALAVPVSLVVTGASASPVWANPSSLNFTYAQGGGEPPNQTVQIATISGLYYAFTATSSASWLSVLPNSASAPATLSVAVAGYLAVGSYTGTISVTGTSGMSVSIPVSVTVTAAALSLSASPSSLAFSYLAGGSAPAAQAVQLSGSGGAVAFTASTNASWLSVTPTSGSTPATLSVSVAGNLAAGTYSGTMSVTPAGGTAVSIPVSVTVAAAASTLSASPSSLALSYRLGGSIPAAQPLQLTAPGGPAVAFTATASSTGSWLSVTPNSGSTPATLEVSIAPAGLSAGTYNGTVTVNGGALTITVTLTVAAAPLPTITGVVNAASFATGAVSPGELISIVGTALGPANPAYLTLDANGNVATSIGGVTVMVGGRPAPLVYAGSSQINAIVPYEVIGLLAPTVLVNYLGQSSNGFTLQTAAAVPGIFTQTASGSGPGTIMNQDYTLNGPGHPAARGSTVTLYMTGEGQTAPGGVDGKVTVVNTSGAGPVTPAPLLTVTALIGGAPAVVEFAGEAPGLVSGVLQVNVQIPANAPAGDVPIVVSVGTSSSQAGVTVSVE